MKGLMWFRHDLRLTDNPALVSVTRHCHDALMVYVIDPKWFKPQQFHSQPLGHFREQFLYQSLHALNEKLKQFNQRLVIKFGDPSIVIPQLCKKHDINFLAATNHHGVTEKQQLLEIEQAVSCYVHVNDSFTLFLENQLQLKPNDFPPTFSEFKQRVTQQNLLPCIPISAPDELPEPICEADDYWDGQDSIKALAPYQGGEDAGLTQLNQFFWKTDGLKNYKETCEQLDGWNISSRISAWLANGSLSPRTVAAELDKYEYRKSSSLSSETLYNELLWREYFQWMMNHYHDEMFFYDGIKKKNAFSEFSFEKYQAWQQGKTQYPIVNACMNQLNLTGYLSNKGRKLAASCLINELNIDWRYGAAYFEQQLIDFDVASNYGNWQYLAALHSEPQKQSQSYQQLYEQAERDDPNGDFIYRWTKVSV